MNIHGLDGSTQGVPLAKRWGHCGGLRGGASRAPHAIRGVEVDKVLAFLCGSMGNKAEAANQDCGQNEAAGFEAVGCHKVPPVRGYPLPQLEGMEMEPAPCLKLRSGVIQELGIFPPCPSARGCLATLFLQSRRWNLRCQRQAFIPPSWIFRLLTMRNESNQRQPNEH